MHPLSSAPTSRRSAGPSSTPETRLRGRWLTLARAGWVAAALLVLVIFLGSLPDSVRQLQTRCPGSRCTAGQLSPDTARSFQALGLSPNSSALATLTLTLLFALVCFALGSLVVDRGNGPSYVAFCDACSITGRSFWCACACPRATWQVK